ncbi:MAG: hypothetical protein Q8K63_13465 [Acidimicrobiales bacterium]|nr:hypothetical protein [Acidimicrobiales bacterium]
MAEFYANDKTRERRLADIRARRGSADRDAHIAEIAERKQQAKKAAATRKAGPSARKTRENSSEYHGHSWDEWDRMRDAGLALITARAAQREYTSHTELWGHLTDELGKGLGNAHFQMPALLEHIALKGFDDIGLVVSALAVDDGAEPSPGIGFFRIAVDKKMLDESELPEGGKDWKMTDGQRAFFQSHAAAVFDKFAPGE